MGDIIKELGWPHFAFLFGVVFVIVFKNQLAGLISRITSIDKRGVKAEPTPEAQREQKKTETVQELLIAVGDSIVLRDCEGHITSEFNSKGLETNGDTTKVLIKYLAAALITLGYEQIHNLIFGSQIFLLKKLNEVRGQGFEAIHVIAHFNYTKEFFMMA